MQIHFDIAQFTVKRQVQLNVLVFDRQYSHFILNCLEWYSLRCYFENLQRQPLFSQFYDYYRRRYNRGFQALENSICNFIFDPKHFQSQTTLLIKINMVLTFKSVAIAAIELKLSSSTFTLYYFFFNIFKLKFSILFQFIGTEILYHKYNCNESIDKYFPSPTIN